jgi:hypothetical protein
MQTDKHKTEQTGHVMSCEIIQDIFGLGVNSLLLEDEEVLFERLMLKYKRQTGTYNKTDGKRDDQSLEHLIRRTLFLRKAELGAGISGRPVRKESLVNKAARPISGTVDKVAGDAPPDPRRIRLA